MKTIAMVLGSTLVSVSMATAGASEAGYMGVKSDVHPQAVKDDTHPVAVKDDTHPRRETALTGGPVQSQAYDLNPNDLSVKDERKGVVINHEEQYRAFPPKGR